MDYLTFKTRTAAVNEIHQMHGWPSARPVKLTAVDDDGRDAWVIEADVNQYLRRDHFVR